LHSWKVEGIPPGFGGTACGQFWPLSGSFELLFAQNHTPFIVFCAYDNRVV